MRRIDAPIDVTVRKSRPVHIRWERREWEVQRLLECWVHTTRWWGTGPSERRTYYRLEIPDGVVEIYRTHGQLRDEWTLSRISD